MKQANSSEALKNVSSLSGEIESGAGITSVSHKGPVAEVARPSAKPKPAWSRPGLRLTVHGASLAKAILEARRTR
jgi:hypothetical protein